MRARLSRAVGGAGVLALVGGMAVGLPATAQAVATTGPVVVNEVYGGGGNTGATYLHDFVELVNTSSAPVALDGWSVQYAGATGTAYQVTALTGTLLAGGSYVVREAGGANTAATPVTGDATGAIAMSGTAGKVALVSNATALSCLGDCDSAAGVVDFVGYGTANDYEGTGPAVAASNTTSVSRNAAHSDSGDNKADFTAGAPTPQACGSACTPTPVDSGPTVTATTPANGATSVSATENLAVTFSEPVELTDAFALTCGGTDHPFTVGGSGASYTVDPAADLPPGGSCTLTVKATGVEDSDTNDPPGRMAADVVVTFSTGSGCGSPFTPAYTIQGSGPTAAVTGTVTTQGVVVGDYEGASPALRGFYLQDPAGDADATTSDAVFVFEGSNNSVSLGDVVRVTGNAGENQGQTQVTMAVGTTAEKCGTGTVTPVDVTLPFASVDYPERFEGMLVRMPQTLTVTEHFQLGRFGQVLMSSGGKLPQPTSLATPGGDALALQAANDRNQILFDDASQAQNPDPILFGRGGQPLSATNTLRGGDTATSTVGVMTYTWGGNAASPNAFRLRPVGALGGGVPDFQPANPRPAGSPAPAAGTDVRVAGMNLLNFFNTFSGCTGGVSGAALDCRGANSQAEFDRQWPKTVSAVVGTEADVVGINEIENNGYGPGSAIQFLVDKLNAATSPGTYAFVDVDAQTGQTDAAGSDAIKVGVLYKPGVVTPVGHTAVLNSTEFVNGGDSGPRSRPSVAQAFEVGSTGSRFVVDVNHLKSKGSACDTADTGDGQGNCNLVRTRAATALASWLGSDPTGIGDPDVLMVGDYNSYAMEDPVRTLEQEGYTNLIRQRLGAAAYSYVFDGQWGYLDYAFGSASIQPQVAAVHEWHVDADEPSVLDYNSEFKTAGQQQSLYAPDEFRISDHDPVLVDLALTPAAESSSTSLSVSPASQVYGTTSPATWTATVSLSRGGTAAGSVELLDGATVVDSAAVGTNGAATGTLPAFLGAGDHTLTARFVPADTTLATGSTSAPSSAFTVARASSTTSVSAVFGKVKTQGRGSQFLMELTAQVALQTGRSTAGTVTFTVDGVPEGEAVVAGGTASTTVTVPKGTHDVTATFVPSDAADITGSTSPVVTVRVK